LARNHEHFFSSTSLAHFVRIICAMTSY